jgi:uncharacterized protein (DUF1778 family)
MPRPRKAEQPLTQTAFRLTEEELEMFRAAAQSQGVSVGQFLRSAGTAIAGDEEALARALQDQQDRDDSLKNQHRVLGDTTPKAT